MKSRTVRLLPSLFFIAMAFASAFASGEKSKGDESGEKSPAKILLISLDGTVNPGSSDFFISSLVQAENSGFDALLIELNTPGGLVESTRDIVQAFLNAKVPVIVYVTPAGARAGSAGVMITMAAHVAVMTPGTNIGAAHPVAGGGEKIDEVMSAKITNDTAAWVEGIAEQRGRNKEWAIKAVRDSVSVTATEAFKIGVIDFLADDLDDLLEKIEGREVELSGKKKVTLHLRNARIVRLEPGLKHRVLMRLADPNLAYIFMIVGFLGIYAEFSNPGLIFPGLIGAVSFLLFLMSTQVLPINLVGIILIFVGMGMFIAEIKVASYGALTLGGAVALGLGSIFLFDVPEKIVDYPNFSFNVSWSLILPVTIGFTLMAGLITTLVIRAQRARPQTGNESLIGEIARASSDIDAEGGQVKFQGVYWSAVCEESVKKGEKVRVTQVKGASIVVVPENKVV